MRLNPDGASSVVLVCEHASNFIPASFNGLGLAADARQSHVAWDPGAIGVAARLAQRLDAALIAGAVSRLVYDCNRPPDAPDAMPERSEIFDIPGNIGLSVAARAERIATCYEPFRKALSQTIAQTSAPVLVTIHSFTPVYHGTSRTVELGILHDRDSRLADTMLATAPRHTQADVQRNQPYGPEHGVTHTLKEHAISGGHMNVMLEIRNNLIATEPQQHAIADMLAAWITDAFAQTKEKGTVRCVT